jgi:hypothetical protein
MKNLHKILSNEPTKKGDIAVGITLKIWDGEGEAPHHSYDLYITSEEEIKEGWHLNNVAGVNKPVYVKNEDVIPLKKVYGNNVTYLEKIILTTDEKLISDGVQPIPNDFVEWFIDNPKCEEVEVNKEYHVEIEEIIYEGDFQNVEYVKYKIIIPKEEPKQETIEETAARLFTEEKYPTSFETLQKAFVSNAKFNSSKPERMYTEVEVYNILQEAMKDNYTCELENHYSGDYRNLKKWFEQHKKTT